MKEAIYGLLGRKLSHSFSSEFFKGLFEAEEINADYYNFEIENIEQLAVLLLKYPQLKGFNVTIPYKEQIIPYLDSLSPEAEEIGAVNTVLVSRKEDSMHLKGFNTDAYGFAEGFRPLLNKAEDGPALILGTGGAAKAVNYSLKKYYDRESHTVSRKPGKGDYILKEITPEIISSHPVIINATPSGMYPDVNGYPDIPYNAVTINHTCLDLVYNPRSTEFIKRCMRKGADVDSGLGMLHFQALRAWDIWNC